MYKNSGLGTVEEEVRDGLQRTNFGCDGYDCYPDLIISQVYIYAKIH